MELTNEQKQAVSRWIEEGLKLSDIQQKLGSEFNLRVTYMDARFIVDDLKLTPKDPVVSQPAADEAVSAPDAPATDETAPVDGGLDPLIDEVDPLAGAGSGGKVAVKVDEITRPGAMVSGSVTFSDGKKAGWYLDQTGRLGMVTEDPGYRPPQADVAQFQIALEQELVRMGM